MLSNEDKRILKEGTFFEQSGLLIDHFDDKNDTWLKESRKYFHECNPSLFNKNTEGEK